MQVLSDEQSFNQNHAAQYLGISVGFLKKLRLDGGGPCYCKIGKKVLYKRIDLDAFIDSSRVSTTNRSTSRRKYE